MPKNEYANYMNSARWTAFREVALARAKRRCRACSSPDDLHVHHLTYERLGNERLEDVVVLCENCHDIVHRIERTTSQDLISATNTVTRAAQWLGRSPHPTKEFVKQRGRANIDDFFAAERESRRRRA